MQTFICIIITIPVVVMTTLVFLQLNRNYKLQRTYQKLMESFDLASLNDADKKNLLEISINTPVHNHKLTLEQLCTLAILAKDNPGMDDSMFPEYVATCLQEYYNSLTSI